LYSTNQNIEESKSVEDKTAIIESFASKYKDIEQIEKSLLERCRVEDREKIGSKEQIVFSPQIIEIKNLLLKEQERLGKFIKEVKKEKIALSKPTGQGKKISKKEKWLKS